MGKMMYGFGHQSNYPQSLEVEIENCLEYLRKSREGGVEGEYCRKFVGLLGNRVGENLGLLFGGVEGFRVMYLKGLVNFYDVMRRSTVFTRMAKSLKLVVLKTYLTVLKP